jgi:hypothetical protein
MVGQLRNATGLFLFVSKKPIKGYSVFQIFQVSILENLKNANEGALIRLV